MVCAPFALTLTRSRVSVPFMFSESSLMANQVDNKFTWVISNFSSLQCTAIYSEHFIVGGCKWCLLAYPKGLIEPDLFDVFVEVVEHESLPSGWRRLAGFSLTIVNQNLCKNFQLKESLNWFDEEFPLWSSDTMIPLAKILAGGFLVNDELKIVAEIDVLEVIGKLDVSEAAIRPLKKRKVNDYDGAVASDLLKETIDVNGFQVLPSQVDAVRRIFEKHPDIASKFRGKNPLLKATYMNVLLNLTAILRQLPREISKDDLANAYVLTSSLKDAGFEVGWLEKKVNEVWEKKDEEKACKDLMAKVSDASSSNVG